MATDRHPQSAPLLEDIQRVISLSEKILEENALIKLELQEIRKRTENTHDSKLVDVYEAKRLTGASIATIKRNCKKQLKKGISGRSMFLLKDVMLLKK